MKKFLAMFLAIMAMLTVCAVAVSADEEATAEYYLFLDGKTKTDLFTSATVDSVTTYTKAGANLKKVITNAATFQTLDEKTATVDKDGVVTPVKTGDVKVRVWDAEGNKLGDFQLHVIKKTVVALRVEKISKYTEYYVGDKIENDHINVYLDFNNGDEDIKAAADEYTISYDGNGGRLTTPGDSIEVTVKSVNNPAIEAKYGVKVKTNWVKSLTLALTGGSTNFDEGDVLPGLNITAEYEDGNKTQLSANSCDIQLSEDNKTWETVSTSRLLKTTDKYIRVSYNGVDSKSIRIYVTAVSGGSGSGSGDNNDDNIGDTSDYMGFITGTLSKKTYNVGEKIDWTGVTVTLKNGETTVKTFSSSDLQSLAIIYDTGFGRKFVEADVKGEGQTNVVLEFEYLGNTYKIVVTGLTVKKSLGTLSVTDIDGIVFDAKTYKVGQVLKLDDINYVIIHSIKNGVSQSTVIMGEELASYNNAISLQVLTADKKAKSSKPTTIESANLLTKSSDGTSYVNVRFTIDSKHYDTTLTVTNPDVEVYYNGSLLDTYSTIDEALEAVDKLSVTEYPPITGKVVTIKLTNDEKVSSNVVIDAERRIEINLNGKKLSMESDTVNPNTDYYVEITNTSSTAATFTYTDKKINIILAKGESFTFEEDYDEDDLLPGVYAVTLNIGKNGEVKSEPDANDDNEIIIGHGNEIELVFTPKSGYKVEEIALGTTKFTSTTAGYSEKDGVVTIKIKATSSVNGKTLKATFSENDPLADWDNPFTDVKSSASYYDAVAFVNVNGLLQGVDTTKFSPTGTLTRAQFVTILGRLCGIDADLAEAIYGTKTSKFTDVNKNDKNYGRYEYAVPYIVWATEEGIIEGHGGNEKGTFGPLDPITHQQMYVIMERYADKIEGLSTAAATQTLTFTDKGSIASWAVNAVKYAQKMDFIVETSTNKISPETNAKRWELAVLLQKFCVNVLGWEG